MNAPQTVEATPAQAADMVRGELNLAQAALQAGDSCAACDGYARALGLALQLGPAPVVQVLAAVLGGARELARRPGELRVVHARCATGAKVSAPGETGQPGADDLSALGPALVGMANQVREAGVLPDTPAMEAWASVANGIGAMVGQLGVALSLPAERRAGMAESVRSHAAALDEATGGLFALCSWLDEVVPAEARAAS